MGGWWLRAILDRRRSPRRSSSGRGICCAELHGDCIRDLYQPQNLPTGWVLADRGKCHQQAIRVVGALDTSLCQDILLKFGQLQLASKRLHEC
jgi:hypothetical protein